ncbi:MAG: caspase family protein [Spirochaetia bacterium]|nr:caspase family protein [Spirochaetia bacterium]
MKKGLLAVIGLVVVLLAVSPVEAKRIAAVFGSNYKNNQADIPPLDLCEADAQLLIQSLKDQGHFDDVKVLLGQMVTASNVEKTLKELSRTVGPDDTVVLYFYGHGTYQRDASAPNGLRNYIVMFERPHVSDDQLNTWLKGIKSKKTVWIFDCCFSGGIVKKGRRGMGDIPQGKDSPGTVIENGDDQFYFDNKAIIGSSDSNETSIEVGPPINHGIFTYYFAEALKLENGDLNNDKTVTALEAFEWSAKRIVDHAAKFNHKQHPQMSGNASGVMIAGNVKPIPPKPNPNPTDIKPDPDNKPEPDPIKPQPTHSDPEDPITPDEPNVVDSGKTGKAVIYTTILESTVAGQNAMDAQSILRKNRSKRETRRVRVTFSGKDYPSKVTWLDEQQLKAETGETIPLGTYTHDMKVFRNKVAKIEVDSIPTGVHEIEIQADDYPVYKEPLGVEEKVPGKTFVVCSLAGLGTIRGKVFLNNFERPQAGRDIWMPSVKGVNINYKMTTTKDGSFWFLNLPPDNDYMIKASFLENLKLDQEKIAVKPGATTKVDVVLTK